MSRVALVTDSTAYIPQELVQKYSISVAPQILIWGQETFRDGVDIQPGEFYNRLKKATIMPTTSQATIPAFEKIFKDLVEQGCEVLSILISGKLSGTIDSAVHARESFPGASIEIVDSQSTAMAMGYQILTVARAIEAGANLVEAKALAEKARDYTGVIFAVDTMEFLHRGGRIGGGTRFLGTALNIKPILELTGGRVEAVERVRTRKKSLQRLVDMVVERTANRKPVRLATLHADAEEDARQILEMAKEKIEVVESVFSEVSPVVGTHAGPGTVGLAYMAGL